MTDMATPPETVERELGGCPVMHRDLAPEQPAGSHWEMANELRETSPVFFNTYAQGYWVFTRHDEVREMYKTPEIFSSESITPWDPDPVYRFVPTQIDAPDHIKYRQIVNPWFSPERGRCGRAAGRTRSCRRLVDDLAADGRVRLRHRLRAALPTEVFLTIIGVRPPTPTCSSRGSRTSSPASAATPPASSAMARRSAASASTGSTRWPSAAATPSRARTTSSRTCCTRRSTTSR